MCYIDVIKKLCTKSSNYRQLSAIQHKTESELDLFETRDCDTEFKDNYAQGGVSVKSGIFLEEEFRFSNDFILHCWDIKKLKRVALLERAHPLLGNQIETSKFHFICLLQRFGIFKSFSSNLKH